MIKMTYNNWDDYFYKGTNVLKNKLDIIDPKELEEKEIHISSTKLRQLMERPLEMSTYDKERLKRIHSYLFSDIYDWAGEYRTVNMAIDKDDFVGSSFDKISTVVSFAPANLIDSMLHEAFDEADGEIDRSSNINTYCEALARLYAKLMYIHPFREGNGRSSREFIREYSNYKRADKDFEIGEFKWSKIDREVLHKGIDVAMTYPGNISSEFMKTLKIENNNKRRR